LTPQRAKKLNYVAGKRFFDLTVVLENVHDPHNVSAILRTCDAVGVAEVHVVNTIMPWHNKGKKSSASAKNWVKVYFYRELDPCLSLLKENNFTLLATHLGSKAQNVFDLNLSQRIAFVFGNEHAGISGELLQQCDGNINIPMNGMVPSLNVSVSAAICLYETFRQRNLQPFNYSLEAENVSLLNSWTENEIKRSKKTGK
jgi:tRNA (guanosine-2'-O-)-methyltransferase